MKDQPYEVSKTHQRGRKDHDGLGMDQAPAHNKNTAVHIFSTLPQELPDQVSSSRAEIK